MPRSENSQHRRFWPSGLKRPVVFLKDDYQIFWYTWHLKLAGAPNTFSAERLVIRFFRNFGNRLANYALP